MRTLLAAGCVLVLLVSTASGQDQEKPRRPGGGGGRGGFGGGGGRGGPGGGMQDTLGILAMPEVQQELALDEAKKKQVNDLVEKTRQEVMSSFNFRDLQDLSDEERQKKMEEVRKKGEEVNKKAIADLAKILDAKQLERFHQLKLQREGVAALGQPEVAEKLGLSQEQKDKIKKIQDEARTAGGNFGRLSDEERREFFAKREERQQKTNSDLLAVMTPAQKESWDKMLGKKFDFPQRQFGRGGFGGGPGGPGGGGRGEGAGEKKRPEAKKDQ